MKCFCYLAAMIIAVASIGGGCENPSATRPSSSPQNDAYVFPVQPGTEAWRRFGSHDEMVRATQVPEVTLNQMETPALLQTVLMYPLLGEVNAYNSPQRGIEAVAEQFNGLREFLLRPDAGRALVATYREIDPTRIDPAWSLADQGDFSARISIIELLLAQPSVLADLTNAERRSILAEGITTLRAKERYQQVYGGLALERTAFLLGRTFEAAQPGVLEQGVRIPEEVREFMRQGHSASTSAALQVVAVVERFLVADTVDVVGF